MRAWALDGTELSDIGVMRGSESGRRVEFADSGVVMEGGWSGLAKGCLPYSSGCVSEAVEGRALGLVTAFAAAAAVAAAAAAAVRSARR